MQYRFLIKKRRGRFLLLLGRAEDKGRDFGDIRTTYFAKLIPSLGTDFATGAEAQAALAELKGYIAAHPLYKLA